MISSRAAFARGRADRRYSPGGRPKADFRAGQHRPVASEARDVIAENVPDQPRVVFIGVGDGIAARFIHFPFHASEIVDA